MNILFDHPFPFALAHGGLQTQIQQTKTALESIGVDVDFVRWWDEGQEGNLLHFFGRPAGQYIQLAHQKRRRVVLAELLGGLGARGPFARAAQRTLITLAQRFLPADLRARLAWDAYRKADACVALTSWEGHLMTTMFSAPPDRVQVVPNGVEPVFVNSISAARGPWLVCTATITEVKRVVELAEAALTAQTPLWVIGRAFDNGLDYPRKFFGLARQNPKLIRYEGPLQDRAALARAYREARGFVLLSRWETLSIAALEAAACECPLLLSDLPWARSVFGDQASYCPATRNRDGTARALRTFYDRAPDLPKPPKPKTWLEVAQQLKSIYESLLSRPW